MTPLDYGIVIGFLLVMALAGLTISRLIRTSDDFFVAGRELTPFILCATITSTNLSMMHFIGMGGIVYLSGAAQVWNNWTGDIALVLSGLLVVPLLRRLRMRSVPEFLELRYGKGLRTLIGAFWGIRLCVFLGILLYIAATAAIVITGCADTAQNYVRWLFAFSVVSILYSVIGGAWAVAIMDSVQFVVMLGGALIVLPIVVHAAGGMHNLFQSLRDSGQAGHLDLIPPRGEFNWLFISAYLLLGIKWSTVDQAILQRAFGARTPRISAQGMVLSAIITTPIALFWMIPGLVAAKLHPGFASPDHAIPWLLATYIPPAGRGLLGIVLCGLIAAQISAITADVNSVATLFTSDVYRTLRSRAPSQRELLIAVRISSLVCGGIMLLVAYWLHDNHAGAVRANLTVVGILDMPLFVITIIYGLLWKRANWQGATAGFIGGGLVGVLTYVLIVSSYFDHWLAPVLRHLPDFLSSTITAWHNALAPNEKSVRNLVPFISSGAALIITPIVSLITQASSVDRSGVWAALRPSDSAHGEDDTFHLIPISLIGRAGLAGVVIGFGVFLFGLVSAHWYYPNATPLAVAGMLAVFIGGVIRAWAV